MTKILTRKRQLGFAQSHAFVIGIDEYPYMSNNLNNAVDDAADIAELLKVVQGFDNVLLMRNPNKVQIKQLLDWLKNKERSSTFSILDEEFSKEAASIEVRNKFRNPPYKSEIYWLKTDKELTNLTADEKKLLPQLKPEATTTTPIYLVKETAITISSSELAGVSNSVVFYYAGHGLPKKSDIKNGPQGYLAPTDAVDNRFIDKTLLPMDDVYEAFSDLNCHHTLLILDCCFAGRFRFSELTRSTGIGDWGGPMHNDRFDRFKNGRALQVLVSAGPDQLALDAADWAGIRGNSPFAKTLIKALGTEGLADIRSSSNEDGVITVTELKYYIWNKLEEISSKKLDVPQYADLFPMKNHGVGQFIFFNPTIGIDQEKFANDPRKNPYKGLKPYELADAELFFGRATAIGEILEKFEQLITDDLPPILFISAPSGYGKSSLVKAGVLPKLGSDIEFNNLRPNELDHNLATIAAKFEALEEALATSAKRLFLVDQYEEFFDLFDNRKLQEKLLKLLKTIDAKKHKVILTIRSDFDGQMRKSPLKEYWNTTHIYRLAAVKKEELREALVMPAKYAFRFFQDHAEKQDVDHGETLIDEILQEVTNAPGALPLLSSTMYEFYELGKIKNRGRRLILGDYKNLLGGVQGALSLKADKVYNATLVQKTEGTEGYEAYRTQYMHTKAEQEIMKKILLRMTKLSGGAYTRRRVFYVEPVNEEKESEEENVPNLESGLKEDESENGNNLVPVSLRELDFPQNQDLVNIVIDKLRAANIIVQGIEKGKPYVEPVHDSLFTHWDTFQEWIKKLGESNLMLQRQLWQAVLDREKGILEKKNLKNLNDIQATPQDSQNETPEDILTSSSLVWDNSPKLLQVLNEIDFKVIQEIMTESNLGRLSKELLPFVLKKFRPLDDAYFAKLFSPLNAAQLKDLFSLSTHWLNQAEVQFIFDSWERKESRFAQLRRERDEAIKAKEIAEYKTKEAQATAFAAQARQVAQENPTYALNLAFVAYQMIPSLQNLAAYLEINSGFPKYKKSYSGHFENVYAVAFSPDEQFMFVGNLDGRIILLEIESGEVKRVFRGHFDWISSISFSSDGETMLTSSGDRSIKLWKVETGEIIRSFNGHQKQVSSAAFSPDGKTIISGSFDKSIKLWKVETGEIIRSFNGHADVVSDVAFSPDGQQFVSGSFDKTAILWEVLTGQIVRTFRGHLNAISSVAFTHNNVLTGSGDGRVRMWDTHTGKDLFVTRLLRHSGGVTKVAFSPDGRYILSGSDDKTVKLWDIRTDFETTLKGHTSSINAIAFSLSGQQILTGSYDKTVKLWEFDQFDQKNKTTMVHNQAVFQAVFSPNENYILSGGNRNTAILWNAKTLEKINTFIKHQGPISAVAFSPNGQYILTGSWDKTAILWDIESRKIRQIYRGHSGELNSVAFSPDGAQILTSSLDHTAILWELKTGAIKTTYRGHHGFVRAAIFTHDGAQILTASDDTTIKLWDTQNAKVLKTFKGHIDRVRTITFSSKGRFLVSGSFDNTAKLWDMETEKLVHTFIGHGATVGAVAFSLDDKLLLTGSADKTAVLWDVLSKKPIRTFHHKGSVMSVAFTSDNSKILTGSFDGTAKIWNNHLTKWNPMIYKLNSAEKALYNIEIDY